METKLRSGSKSLIWRILGVFILAAVTFAYTGSWITTGLVTVIHHAVFLLVYYLHERAWQNRLTKQYTLRSMLKCLTYETLCGNVILGAITYGITGNVKTMTAVTLTYIGIKHVTYVLNEFVWKKIKWQNA
ncbi:MAG: DUF2061 domain-containing protein [Candidatus Thorarchaeota archaeon]|jgi:uncharacterized membrane protein